MLSTGSFLGILSINYILISIAGLKIIGYDDDSFRNLSISIILSSSHDYDHRYAFFLYQEVIFLYQCHL